MGFWSKGKEKPEIETNLYSRFIKTAIESKIGDDVHVFVHVCPCDWEGRYSGKLDRIKFVCQVSNLSPTTQQVLKEHMWEKNGYYQFIDGLNDYGEPLNGFTVREVWRLHMFVDDNKFPKYSNYAHIMRSLGEYTSNLNGVTIQKEGGWSEGFSVFFN